MSTISKSPAALNASKQKFQVHGTDIAGVMLIEPRVFEDGRGFFMETFHKDWFAEHGLDCEFVQDNHSRSAAGTLRGLHYQTQHAQGKLVRCVAGEIFDVAVDIRRDSATFGRWYGAMLTADNRRQLYVPPGLAHGFCALTDGAEVVYKCTNYYYPAFERSLLWNDPAIGIQWPIAEPLLSDKDRAGGLLQDLA